MSLVPPKKVAGDTCMGLDLLKKVVGWRWKCIF